MSITGMDTCIHGIPLTLGCVTCGRHGIGTVIEPKQEIRVKLNEAEIQKISVGPNELLVLRVAPPWNTPEQLAALTEVFTAWLEGRGLDWPFIVISDTITLSKVEKYDDSGTAAPTPTYDW